MTSPGSRRGRYGNGLAQIFSHARSNPRRTRYIRLGGDGGAGYELEPRICMSALSSCEVIAGQGQVLKSGVEAGLSTSDMGTVPHCGKIESDVEGFFVGDSQRSSTNINDGDGNSSPPTIDYEPIGFVGPPYDHENQRARQPAETVGSFLTGGAEVSPGDDKAISFGEVVQGSSDTCVFTSVLSAVALTNFDLASGITIASKKSATDIIYNVRLYEPAPGGGFKPVLIPEEFDGTVNQSEATSTDSDEFWPTLYLRAYLSLELALHQDYHRAVNAFEALTGRPAAGAGHFGTVVASDPAITPSWVAATLGSGTPIVAGTLPVSAAHPDPFKLDQAHGIIGFHSYTILGIEIPASGAPGSTYVTLRNPWAIDTTASYFDSNHDRVLQPAEYANFQQGLDGNNDGIIRVPWSVFSTYFCYVTVSSLTGPSINSPAAAPPAFNQAAPAPIGVYAGQSTGPINVSATDPHGKTVAYHLATNDRGSVNASGQYSWTPLPNQIGAFQITVTAQSTLLSSVSETFTVTVKPDVPTINSVLASPSTVSATGTDLLTLKASGVSDPAGPVDHVAFWLDSSGNGSFNRDRDSYLGSATAATGWSLATYVGGTFEGNYKVFAIATRVANGYTFDSAPATTAITITAAPPYSVVAVPWTDQIHASGDASVPKLGAGTTVDSAGNIRVFWTVFAQTDSLFVRKYNRSGQPLTAPVQLASSIPPTGTSAASFAGLPDGSFDAVYFVGPNLFVQRFSASATAVGNPILVASASYGGGALSPAVSAAADSNGNLSIVYSAGQYFPFYESHVYFARVSAAGQVAFASMLSTNTGGNQQHPTVAINAAGAGVVAWADDTMNAIIARLVTGAGLTMGSELAVYHDPSARAGQVSAAVDARGEVTLTYVGLDGIHARRYRSDGTHDGGDFKVYTSLGDIQTSPTVATSGQGWSVIAWNDANAGPSGAVVAAQVYDPEGRPQGTPFLVPSVLASTGLTGLAFGDNGFVSVEFIQEDLNGGGQTVTNFRLYRVDLEPAFQGKYQFTATLGSAVGTVVGAVKAIDPDGDQIDYKILGQSPFAVDLHSGQITVADGLALKSTAATNYQLTIQADDSSAYANQKPVTSVMITIVEGAPPTLASIRDRVIDAGGYSAIGLYADAPSGAALTYTAVAQPLPYWLKQTYGLYQNPSGYNTGQRGASEKYVRGKVSSQGYAAQGTDFWYYLLPNGDLYELAPPYAGSALSGVKVATLGPAVYANPALLTAAAATTVPAAASTFGSVVSVVPDAEYTGTFGVVASATDGLGSASRRFLVTVVVPVLAPIADQTIVGSGKVVLNGTDASNAALTYSATAESLPYWLERTYGLYKDASGYHTGQSGANEKYLRGKVSSQGYASQRTDYWYYLLPNGDLYELVPPYAGAAVGVKVASLSATVYADPTLLTAATATAVPVALSIDNSVLNVATTGRYAGTFVIVASVSDGIATASQAFRVDIRPKTIPLITWAKPADIVAGTPLGAAQLNAAASVPGVFTYTPAAGTILHSGAGQPLAATFTPTDVTHFTTATATVFINVKQPDRTPPRVTGIVSLSRTTKGLTAITVGFNEAMDRGSVANKTRYILLGGVKKRGKTVYSVGLGIKGISFDGKTRVVITLAKPYKGAVKVTILGGIRAANGTSSTGTFTTAVT